MISQFHEESMLATRNNFNGSFMYFPLLSAHLISTPKREAARRGSQEAMDGGLLTLSTSKRIAYCAAQQSRVAAAHARDHADLGRSPGSARGPGPDEMVGCYWTISLAVEVAGF